jgi:dUTP pyrophosphatase
MKFKLLKHNVGLPCIGTEHSAGIDLRLAHVKLSDHGVYTLGLGVAVEMPRCLLPGYIHAGLLLVRSSWGEKGLSFTNDVGLIDFDYRGELKAKCTFEYRGYDFPEIGERIAQLTIMPMLRPEIEIVEELTNTVRGEGGYGSTNK